MKRKSPLLLLLALATAGCSMDGGVEEKAGQMLSQARQLLQQKCYAAARDTVEAMRLTYPTAFESRAAGIVVMDSIELCEAQDSLAAVNKWLQTELDVLSELERIDSDTREGRDRIRAQQKRVAAARWKSDEVCAKVNFYLRKIDIDKAENAAKE